MLNFNQDGLQIFDNFEIDKSLPKYVSQGDVNVNVSDGNFIVPVTRVIDGRTVRGVNTIGGFQEFGVNTTDAGIQIVALEKDSLKEWFGRKLKKWGNKLSFFEKKSEVVEFNHTNISIEEFFKSIKNSKRQMEKIDNRIESYEAALQQAQDLGQVALKQELERKIDVVRSETQLYANNLVKIVLEAQVVQFYKESEKGVRLDWIKNFTRTIPEKFVKIKNKLDSLKVFDNYVIMHYDPNGEAISMTDKEKEAAKDPILFGVIANSRKLYYIGDWVDEYCDLTLDDFIKKFGKKAITKNNITAKIDVQIDVSEED